MNFYTHHTAEANTSDLQKVNLSSPISTCGRVRINVYEDRMEKYFKFDGGDTCTNESFDIGMKKLPQICKNIEEEKDFPELGDALYIAGIIKNRFLVKKSESMDFIKGAIKSGCSVDYLKDYATAVENYGDFLTICGGDFDG